MVTKIQGYKVYTNQLNVDILNSRRGSIIEENRYNEVEANNMEYASKILMLTKSEFSKDPRVFQEAKNLTKNGFKVTVIALRGKDEKWKSLVKGVSVYRIPRIKLFKKSKSYGQEIKFPVLELFKEISGYICEYLYFTVSCLLFSLVILAKEGFDIIHAHNPPDTLFIIGFFYKKLLGKKFIFDHHDLSPELFLSRFSLKKSIVYKGLILAERLTCMVANRVIATNESYKEIEIKRDKVKPENVFVVRNGPNLNRLKLIEPDSKLKAMNRAILGYLGTMNPQDGLDYLLRSIKHLVFDLKRTDFYCVLIGAGDSLPDLKRIATDLKIEDYVWFTGYIRHEDMIPYLSATDICLNPDPSSPLNEYSTFIKIMEYMALGKPIVAFDLKETRFSAQGSAIYVKPNDELEFAKAIVTLMDDPELRKRLGAIGRKRAEEKLAWVHTSKNLIKAYQSLLAKKASN